MWSQWMVDSWGYGGYGPFHMIIWIILVIAFVAGVVWRVVRAQQKKVILNSFCSGTFAQHNSKDICHRMFAFGGKADIAQTCGNVCF
jgi:hypothetical protein